jgi:hypothetical protein
MNERDVPEFTKNELIHRWVIDEAKQDKAFTDDPNDLERMADIVMQLAYECNKIQDWRM